MIVPLDEPNRASPLLDHCGDIDTMPRGNCPYDERALNADETNGLIDGDLQVFYRDPVWLEGAGGRITGLG